MFYPSNSTISRIRDYAEHWTRIETLLQKPYLRRWLRDTLVLFVRSPLRFGQLIAALGWLDTFVVKVTGGLVIDERWIERLGMLLLPVVWTVVSAVARGADDGSQTWVAARSLARRRVWSGALTSPIAIPSSVAAVIYPRP